MTNPTITGISHIDLTVTDRERSVTFYKNLLGASEVMDGRNDDHHFSSTYLLHAESLLILGLVEHDETATTAFDEHTVGLDHLSFNVASRDELKQWQNKLEADGVAHSPIVTSDNWDVLVARDPDNIQLEFFYMKPAAADLLVD